MPSIAREQDNIIFITPDYRGKTHAQKPSLIKKEILLASARDGIKRQSSFYDKQFVPDYSIY